MNIRAAIGSGAIVLLCIIVATVLVTIPSEYVEYLLLVAGLTLAWFVFYSLIVNYNED